MPVVSFGGVTADDALADALGVVEAPLDVIDAATGAASVGLSDEDAVAMSCVRNVLPNGVR